MTCDAVLPPLSCDANKYTRGKLVVVAGSQRYTGSPVLAACASERMGTGYTLVVTAAEAVPLVRAASPSLVVLDFSQWQPDDLSVSSSRHPLAVCLGPGFQGTKDEKALMLAVLSQASCPMVVDGTALSFLPGKKMRAALKKRARKGIPTVLTPHGGEAARLAKGVGVAEGDPGALADALARAYHSVVALKGPVTHVSDGNCHVVMDEGTPALAKSGTGDVLAGMVGSLLTQGASPMMAAYGAALVHAHAGRWAAAVQGERSVVAADLIDAIPAIIKDA